MLYKEIIAICFEIHNKHNICPECGIFLMLKLVVHKVLTGFKIPCNPKCRTHIYFEFNLNRFLLNLI